MTTHNQSNGRDDKLQGTYLCSNVWCIASVNALSLSKKSPTGSQSLPKFPSMP